jgi:hypothetical protein
LSDGPHVQRGTPLEASPREAQRREGAASGGRAGEGGAGVAFRHDRPGIPSRIRWAGLRARGLLPPDRIRAIDPMSSGAGASAGPMAGAIGTRRARRTRRTRSGDIPESAIRGNCRMRNPGSRRRRPLLRPARGCQASDGDASGISIHDVKERRACNLRRQAKVP